MNALFLVKSRTEAESDDARTGVTAPPSYEHDERHAVKSTTIVLSSPAPRERTSGLAIRIV
jgi:hypothetical protein